jgi:tetratricopeptide (TPR) repeat protein
MFAGDEKIPFRANNVYVAYVRVLAWSPNGKRLAEGGYGEEVRIWDMDTGQENPTKLEFSVSQSSEDDIKSVVWSPDGSQLAVASGHSVWVFEATTGEEVNWLRGHQGRVYSLSWSPDGRRLASAAVNETILWDTVTGERVVTWHELTSDHRTIAWSPDGLQLATAGTEGGEIQIRDAERGYQFVKSPDYIVDMTHRLVATGRTDEVIELLKTRLSEFPDRRDYRDLLAEAYHNRFHIHKRNSDWDHTITDMNDAIQLSPNNSHFYTHRATTYHYHENRQYDEALADYARAVKINPNNAFAYQNRSRLYAELEKYEFAISDYAKLMVLMPSAHNAYLHALAHLGADDVVGYRRACAALVEQYRETDDTDSAHWTAWTCTLAPGALENPGQAVQLAEMAVGADSEIFHVNTLAGALLRDGQYEEAVKQLNELVAEWENAGEQRDRTSLSYICFFLAMAHHHLGHVDDANQFYEQAVAQMKKELSNGTDSGQGASWNRRLTLELLHSEAQALLNATDQRQ